MEIKNGYVMNELKICNWWCVSEASIENDGYLEDLDQFEGFFKIGFVIIFQYNYPKPCEFQ